MVALQNRIVNSAGEYAYFSEMCSYREIFYYLIRSDNMNRPLIFLLLGFSIDPVGSVLVPHGTHYFGIIECDTAKQILEIGLIEYSRSQNH